MADLWQGGKHVDPLHDPRCSDIEVLRAARSIMAEDGYPVDHLTSNIEARERGDLPRRWQPPATRALQREWDRLRDYREQRGLGSGV